MFIIPFIAQRFLLSLTVIFFNPLISALGFIDDVVNQPAAIFIYQRERLRNGFRPVAERAEADDGVNVLAIMGYDIDLLQHQIVIILAIADWVIIQIAHIPLSRQPLILCDFFHESTGNYLIFAGSIKNHTGLIILIMLIEQFHATLR